MQHNFRDDDVSQEVEAPAQSDKGDNSNIQEESEDNMTENITNEVKTEKAPSDADKTDDSSEQNSTQKGDVDENTVKDEESKDETVKGKLESVEKKDEVTEKEKWTKSRLNNEWRKFNLDLTPKVFMHCVELNQSLFLIHFPLY